jgi:dienelactone hydrolase
MLPRFMSLLLVLVIASTAVAQKPEEKKPGDEMIEKYLAKETERISQKVFDGAKNLDEWKAKLPRLRREYMDMLGLWPLPEKTPLHVTITGTVEPEKESVVIDKLHFQSKPGLYVTGNLYRPKKVEGKLPAILYVCGHSEKGRDGNKTAYQDHGMWFATHGYVCLVIDSLQLGEIPGIHHGTYGIRPGTREEEVSKRERSAAGQSGRLAPRGAVPAARSEAATLGAETRMWWQALGYTPAGVECWNGIRAIDYLISRPDVDADKIVVTGISGGGAATFWIAAADERVKCAVPVSGMSDLESYVTNKIINGHCDCMFLVNTYQWEWTTIAALIAPRPLLFANSDADPIFPMDGNRRIIDRLRKLYAWYGKPELVDDYVSKGGHAYRPDLRVAIFQWINKHIKGDNTPLRDVTFQPMPGKELRVFPEDKDMPKDAINGRVDELFVKRAEVKLPETGRFEEWKIETIQTLRERAFRHLPARIEPARTEVILVRGWNHWILSTEENIGPTLISPKWLDQGASKTGSLLVLTPRDDKGGDIPDWARSVAADPDFAHRLEPRGLANGEWTHKSPPNYVARAHAVLGHTADGGKVLDVIASVRHLASKYAGKPNWQVIGRGQAGILAAYAALFEPSISEVIIIDPPTSHRDGPIVLNVLRVLDIPEALGLLAPRPLTLINAKDKAFDRTAEIYKLAGAAEKLQRK